MRKACGSWNLVEAGTKSFHGVTAPGRRAESGRRRGGTCGMEPAGAAVADERLLLGPTSEHAAERQSRADILPEGRQGGCLAASMQPEGQLSPCVCGRGPLVHARRCGSGARLRPTRRRRSRSREARGEPADEAARRPFPSECRVSTRSVAVSAAPARGADRPARETHGVDIETVARPSTQTQTRTSKSRLRAKRMHQTYKSNYNSD